MPILTRFLFALALATALSLSARRARMLSHSGSVAAIAVGTVALLAGWSWTGALLTFFVSSSLLSRWRRAVKERATSSIVEKGGERDAWQVAANGGVFALSALGAILWPSPAWALGGLGALGAATADTWATEVGTAIGGVPRAILSGRAVPAGTSGAVTLAGSIAMVVGALFLGTASWQLGFGKEVLLPVVAGGVTGAVVDTILGATVQERRWCDRCRVATERHIHDCGTATSRRRGWRGMDNDVVNLTSCVAGAAMAVLCGR